MHQCNNGIKKLAFAMMPVMAKYFLNRLVEAPSPGIAFNRLSKYLTMIPKLQAMKNVLPSAITGLRQTGVQEQVSPEQGFDNVDTSYDSEVQE